MLSLEKVGVLFVLDVGVSVLMGIRLLDAIWAFSVERIYIAKSAFVGARARRYAAAMIGLVTAIACVAYLAASAWLIGAVIAEHAVSNHASVANMRSATAALAPLHFIALLVIPLVLAKRWHGLAGIVDANSGQPRRLDRPGARVALAIMLLCLSGEYLVRVFVIDHVGLPRG